jgi:hypothetical protein
VASRHFCEWLLSPRFWCCSASFVANVMINWVGSGICPPVASLSVTGWTVCRFHGARGGGQKGAQNGANKDGLHTVGAVAERLAVAELVRRAREVVR